MEEAQGLQREVIKCCRELITDAELNQAMAEGAYALMMEEIHSELQAGNAGAVDLRIKEIFDLGKVSGFTAGTSSSVDTMLSVVVRWQAGRFGA